MEPSNGGLRGDAGGPEVYPSKMLRKGPLLFMPRTRRDLIFFILGGFFLTNALLAELIGGKLFVLSGDSSGWWRYVVLSVGVLPWPVVFITTDLVNEYFGKEGVRKLTVLAVGMIPYAFVVLYLAMLIPAWENSPVPDTAFRLVFGQSMWIIVGSLTAFVTSQLIDVLVFASVRARTGKHLLWLRATGSTVVSQVFDTFLVGFIAFVLPGKLAFRQFLGLAIGSYLFKLAVAVGITPIIYLGHGLIDGFLKAESAPVGNERPGVTYPPSLSTSHERDAKSGPMLEP